MPTRNSRQIQYNWTTNSDAQVNWRYQWTFFIVNAPREIKIIKEKILDTLGQCGELTEMDSGILIPRKSLNGRLIMLESNMGSIEDKKRQIYNTGKWYRDRTLKPMDWETFGKYCDKFHQH